MAKLLIENGADVNARTSSGDTPLNWMTLNGKIQWINQRILCFD